MYLTIAALAALENIVPPVPADAAAALGGFLAARNPALSAWAVYGVTVAANVATAALTYALARRLGPAFRATSLGARLLPESAVQALRVRHARRHSGAIFVGRILPVYRAVVPPFAGLVGVPAWRAITPIALEAALYYGAVVSLAYRLGTSWDAVRRTVGRVGLVLAVAAALVTVLLVRRIRRRRPARRTGGGLPI